MNKIKVCVIGAGNITNTRHIPALKRQKNVEVIGVLSNLLERSEKTAKKHGIKNYAQINDPKNDIETIRRLDWFGDVDAVVIGTPPHLHYDLVEMSLLLDKHVLVEKPMMMNDGQCRKAIDLAKKKKKSFA